MNQSTKLPQDSPITTSPETFYCFTKIVLLFDGDGGWNLSPEPGEFDRSHQFLRVSVYVSMEHEAAEGCPEVKGKSLIHHAQEDQLHIQLFGDLIYCKILTVQTHTGKQLQLIPKEVHRGRLYQLCFFSSYSWITLQKSVGFL